MSYDRGMPVRSLNLLVVGLSLAGLAVLLFYFGRVLTALPTVVP